MSAKGSSEFGAKGSTDAIVLPNNTNKCLAAYRVFLAQHNLSDGIQALTVFQTLEDLQHVRRWTHLRVHSRYSVVYLTGEAPPLFDAVYVHRHQANGHSGEKDHATNPTQVVVPLTVDQKLSAKKLKSLCDICVNPDTGRKTRCITVAIVDDDTTTAYYRVFSDFSEIVHDQWKVKKRRHDEQTSGTAERTVFNEEDYLKQKPHQRVGLDGNDDEDDGTESE